MSQSWAINTHGDDEAQNNNKARLQCLIARSQEGVIITMTGKVREAAKGLMCREL